MIWNPISSASGTGLCSTGCAFDSCRSSRKIEGSISLLLFCWTYLHPFSLFPSSLPSPSLPTMDAFFQTLFPNPALREFVQTEIRSYAVMSETPTRSPAVYILVGPSRSGKTTFARFVEACIPSAFGVGDRYNLEEALKFGKERNVPVFLEVNCLSQLDCLDSWDNVHMIPITDRLPHDEFGIPSIPELAAEWRDKKV